MPCHTSPFPGTVRWTFGPMALSPVNHSREATTSTADSLLILDHLTRIGGTERPVCSLLDVPQHSSAPIKKGSCASPPARSMDIDSKYAPANVRKAEGPIALLARSIRILREHHDGREVRSCAHRGPVPLWPHAAGSPVGEHVAAAPGIPRPPRASFSAHRILGDGVPGAGMSPPGPSALRGQFWDRYHVRASTCLPSAHCSYLTLLFC